MGFLAEDSEELYQACESLRGCMRKHLGAMEDEEVRAHVLALRRLDKDAEAEWGRELHQMLCDKHKEPYLDSPVG